MHLTKKQMLTRWKRVVSANIRVWTLRRKPKFHLTQVVQVVKKEPDLGQWAYMDAVRKERKGEKGLVVGIDSLLNKDVPEQYANCSYRILFKDGREICFSEEHLTRAR